MTPRSNARRRIARLVSSGRSPPKLCQSPSEIAGSLRPARPAAAVLHRVVAVCRRRCTACADRKERRPAAATMRGRVRQPLRQAAERARRPSQEGTARRGVDLARDARDPPRAARGRRQPHGRPRLRRARARACARRGGAEEPDAGPAGREGRARRADRADGRGRVRARVREVHGHPARAACRARARRRPPPSSRLHLRGRAASRA